MSEIPPRRALVLLGSVLLVEAVLALVSGDSARGDSNPDALAPVLFALTHALLPAGLALFLFCAVRNDVFIPIAVKAAFVIIVGVEVYGLILQLRAPGSGHWATTFQPFSVLMLTLGSPVLWASALVRRDHPGDPALHKYGRLAAGLIQLGFVFQCVVRLRTSADLQYVLDPAQPSAAGATMVAATLVEIAADVVLLAASIQALRTPADEDAVRRRAERTHRLMRTNLLLLPVASLFYSLTNYLQAGSLAQLGGNVWRIMFFPTLLVATTFVLARWYRLQFAASASLIERSGGVQSTGEPS
jgi:hypothetical protein